MPQYLEERLDLEGKGHWRRVPLLSDWMRSISTERKIWTKTSEQLSICHDRCVHSCPKDAFLLKGKHVIRI
jgi:hypothetical protein